MQGDNYYALGFDRRLNHAGWVERAQKAASKTTTKTNRMPTTAVNFGSTVNQPSTGELCRKTYRASTNSENGIAEPPYYLRVNNPNTPCRFRFLAGFEVEYELRTDFEEVTGRFLYAFSGSNGHYLISLVEVT